MERLRGKKGLVKARRVRLERVAPALLDGKKLHGRALVKVTCPPLPRPNPNPYPAPVNLRLRTQRRSCSPRATCWRSTTSAAASSSRMLSLAPL